MICTSIWKAFASSSADTIEMMFVTKWKGENIKDKLILVKPHFWAWVGKPIGALFFPMHRWHVLSNLRWFVFSMSMRSVKIDLIYDLKTTKFKSQCKRKLSHFHTCANLNVNLRINSYSWFTFYNGPLNIYMYRAVVPWSQRYILLLTLGANLQT